MSELADKKLKEWRSGAIRALHEVEHLAWQIRAELENDPQELLPGQVGQIEQLRAQVGALVALTNMSAALFEAGAA